MARRTFAIKTQVMGNRGGAIMDVPHLAILKYAAPNATLKHFEEVWKVRPEAVVLPVNAPDGLYFDVCALGEPRSAYASTFAGGLQDYQDIISAYSRAGIDIYLLVDPTLPFITTPGLHLVDIVGDPSAQACLGNPRGSGYLRHGG